MPYSPAMDPSPPGHLSGRRALGLQYFLHFSAMGVVLPYFNLYCFHVGLTGVEIGVISALRSGSLVLFSLVWGALADRYSARKPIYILCLFASAGIWSFYFTAVDFRSFFIITLFYGLFYSPIISFLEAFTMDVLGAEKKRYGTIRAWGSLSFIAAVVFMGKLIDHYSMDLILIVVLVIALVQGFFSLQVRETGSHKSRPPLLFIKTFFRKDVCIFLGCAFMMLVSHGAYYGFFSIYLEGLGFSKTFIGVSWALASLCEIAVMIRSNELFQKFSLHRVLFVSFLAAASRWTVLAFSKSAVLILLSQTLHAFTYGAFHMASILYIDTLAPDEAKTLGQAANNAVTYGLGLMAGFFLAGHLYEALGTTGLFIISGAVALSGGTLFHLLARQTGSVFPP